MKGATRNEKKTKDMERAQQCLCEFIESFKFAYNNTYKQSKWNHTIEECLRCINKIELQDGVRNTSGTSICTETNTKTNSLTSLLRIILGENPACSLSNKEIELKSGIFGQKETTVYMNLNNEMAQYRASGTQATAFINKCLQVNNDINNRREGTSTFGTSSNYESTCTFSTLTSPHSKRRIIDNRQYQDVYFFGRKRDASKSAGMGSKDSKSKMNRTGYTSSNTGPCRSSCMVSSACSQTKTTRGASAATCTMKAVSIKDDKLKKSCPVTGPTKGDMTVTISHIRIGPKEPCPVHGKEPCQGPKCIVASSPDNQAPVKVTTVTNPRRGVFEIVIRRISGAPLAKNELMLEWTPPPSRPPPCGVPCPIPCAIPTPCRPPKCKMIICRPSKCIPKCCKTPCTSLTCRRCCKIPCKKCMPCGPPCKIPCVPCGSPCGTPCCGPPCGSPCKSMPCFKPCPVGRKRPRKARSQPKIRAHRQRTSPCLNRSKTCPVVRCRSMPSPCISCCYMLPCPPRKCCSVAPCKPPKCCKSACSVCCT